MEDYVLIQNLLEVLGENRTDFLLQHATIEEWERLESSLTMCASLEQQYVLTDFDVKAVVAAGIGVIADEVIVDQTIATDAVRTMLTRFFEFAQCCVKGQSIFLSLGQAEIRSHCGECEICCDFFKALCFFNLLQCYWFVENRVRRDLERRQELQALRVKMFVRPSLLREPTNLGAEMIDWVE